MSNSIVTFETPHPDVIFEVADMAPVSIARINRDELGVPFVNSLQIGIEARPHRIPAMNSCKLTAVMDAELSEGDTDIVLSTLDTQRTKLGESIGRPVTFDNAYIFHDALNPHYTHGTMLRLYLDHITLTNEASLENRYNKERVVPAPTQGKPAEYLANFLGTLGTFLDVLVTLDSPITRKPQARKPIQIGDRLFPLNDDANNRLTSLKSALSFVMLPPRS